MSDLYSAEPFFIGETEDDDLTFGITLEREGVVLNAFAGVTMESEDFELTFDEDRQAHTFIVSETSESLIVVKYEGEDALEIEIEYFVEGEIEVTAINVLDTETSFGVEDLVESPVIGIKQDDSDDTEFEETGLVEPENETETVPAVPVRSIVWLNTKNEFRSEPLDAVPMACLQEVIKGYLLRYPMLEIDGDHTIETQRREDGQYVVVYEGQLDELKPLHGTILMGVVTH